MPSISAAALLEARRQIGSSGRRVPRRLFEKLCESLTGSPARTQKCRQQQLPAFCDPPSYLPTCSCSSRRLCRISPLKRARRSYGNHRTKVRACVLNDLTSPLLEKFRNSKRLFRKRDSQSSCIG